MTYCGTCPPQHPLAHGFLAVSNLMVADELWNPLEKLEIFQRVAARPGIGRIRLA